MNATLFKALIALLPTTALLVGSAVLFLRARTPYSLLQVIGAGCLVLVVLTHVAEALHLFPSMAWGGEHSIGHYVDLVGALFGATLFPAGYLLGAPCVQSRPKRLRTAWAARVRFSPSAQPALFSKLSPPHGNVLQPSETTSMSPSRWAAFFCCKPTKVRMHNVSAT